MQSPHRCPHQEHLLRWLPPGSRTCCLKSRFGPAFYGILTGVCRNISSTFLGFRQFSTKSQVGKSNQKKKYFEKSKQLFAKVAAPVMRHHIIRHTRLLPLRRQGPATSLRAACAPPRARNDLRAHHVVGEGAEGVEFLVQEVFPKVNLADSGGRRNRKVAVFQRGVNGFKML